MILDLIPPFLIGFLGSLHCLGMCGPLVLAYSLQIKNVRSQTASGGASSFHVGLFHHLFFHLGRLFTYGVLGALAATLFRAADLGLFFLNLRGGLTLLGGVLMILMGLVLLKVLPVPGMPTGSLKAYGVFWSRIFPPLFRSQKLAPKMALGLATGFLPCGLSWAMIVRAATTQNIAGGFITMVAFGIGTVPILFLTGVTASIVSLKTRIVGERVAAMSVIVMGLILVLKGRRLFV